MFDMLVKRVIIQPAIPVCISTGIQSQSSQAQYSRHATQNLQKF